MAVMVRDMPLATGDPLGIGGLLSDAVQIARLTVLGGPVNPGLLESVMGSALDGIRSFSRTRNLELPARYRLAFRELGLAIGLAGIEQLQDGLKRIHAWSAGRKLSVAIQRTSGNLCH